MTIELWTLVVEVVGAAGIIVTLAYLAIQLRQSTNQARADNTQATIRRWIDAQTASFRTQADSEFLCRALDDFGSLTAAERGRFSAFMLDITSAFEEILDLDRRGLIDHQMLLDGEKVLAAYVRCPGAMEYWKSVKGLYPASLAHAVDAAVHRHADISPMTSWPHLSEKSA